MGENPNLSRRRFLRGQASHTPGAIRPPGALTEPAFFDACTTCGKCVSACPESLIVLGDGGYPEVRFSNGECTFCNACIDSCPEPALVAGLEPPWRLEVHINDRCLAAQEVVCQSCRDACGASAIFFRPRLGQVAIPAVDAAICTGCGACESACPADALKLTPATGRPPGVRSAHG